MFHKLTTDTKTYYTTSLGLIGFRDYFRFGGIDVLIESVDSLPDNVEICKGCLLGKDKNSECECKSE